MNWLDDPLVKSGDITVTGTRSARSTRTITGKCSEKITVDDVRRVFGPGHFGYRGERVANGLFEIVLYTD